jgi:cell wall-associated NlpC family hydrolase
MPRQRSQEPRKGPAVRHFVAATAPPSLGGRLAGRGQLSRLAVIVTAVGALGVTAACGPVTADRVTNGAGAAAATSLAPCVSGTCWVGVSVATAWVKPWYPRAVDQPALTNPAHPAIWIGAMTLAQKQWLVGRLETQALYGTKVTVIGHWNNWTQVAIASQPTNRDSRGYPGWIPGVQLTRTAPSAATTFAVIRAPSAWLWSGWTSAGVAGAKLLLASYGTSLPVVRATATYVEVTLIGGRNVALRRGDVVLRAAGTSWGATRARVVAEARKFRGLAYLWAGTSGFGFDCSGFTYSVYHAYGVTLSRDADQQAVHGTPVARSALQPGDLVFFRGSATGMITHVGMYVGGGNMIDAPHTGATIRIDPVSSFSYYAGARRYLTS